MGVWHQTAPASQEEGLRLALQNARPLCAAAKIRELRDLTGTSDAWLKMSIDASFLLTGANLWVSYSSSRRASPSTQTNGQGCAPGGRRAGSRRPAAARVAGAHPAGVAAAAVLASGSGEVARASWPGVPERRHRQWPAPCKRGPPAAAAPSARKPRECAAAPPHLAPPNQPAFSKACICWSVRLRQGAESQQESGGGLARNMDARHEGQWCMALEPRRLSRKHS